MANKEITELPSKVSVVDNDLLHVKDPSDNGDKKLLATTLKSYVNAEYDVSPDPDTVALRDAFGRLEAVAGVSGNDVLNFSQLTTSAVDTTVGRVPTYRSQGGFGFGCGGLSPPRVTGLDLNTINVNYASLLVISPVNGPAGISAGLISTKMSDNTTAGIMRFEDNASGRLWFRTKSADVWGSWKELYHTGNLNVNEFGGIGASDRIAFGFAENATTAVFSLPILSKTVPSSITVVGAFNIFRGGTSLFSGVTPTLTTQSSQRIATIQVSGLSGLTPGEALWLFTETSSSKITVNF